MVTRNFCRTPSNLPFYDFKERIGVSIYAEGKTYEFSFKWYVLAGDSKMKLECFYDGIPGLSYCKDLMANLEGENFSPNQIQGLLTALGFNNLGVNV